MFGTQSEKTENFFFDFGKYEAEGFKISPYAWEGNKYEAEGFKISPYAWEGNDFTWIGEYSLEKTPAIVRDKQQKTVSMGGGEFQHTKTTEVPVQLPLERDAMLAEFVEAAKAQGADATLPSDIYLPGDTLPSDIYLPGDRCFISSCKIQEKVYFCEWNNLEYVKYQ